jgi:hypothetical protein
MAYETPIKKLREDISPEPISMRLSALRQSVLDKAESFTQVVQEDCQQLLGFIDQTLDLVTSRTQPAFTHHEAMILD